MPRRINNGFAIFDTSEVQARKPNAQIKLISKALFQDGSFAQHTIPVKIDGKQYLVMVDEGGSAASRAPRSRRGRVRRRPAAVPDGAHLRHQRREEPEGRCRS